MPHIRRLNYNKGVTLALSLPRCVSTLLPPSKYLIYFTTFCLCGNSFLQSQKTQGLVTDHWSSGQDLVRSLPRLDLHLWLETQALLQATTGHLHTREAYRDHCFKNEALCIPVCFLCLTSAHSVYYFLACTILPSLITFIASLSLEYKHSRTGILVCLFLFFSLTFVLYWGIANFLVAQW